MKKGTTSLFLLLLLLAVGEVRSRVHAKRYEDERGETRSLFGCMRGESEPNALKKLLPKYNLPEVVNIISSLRCRFPEHCFKEDFTVGLSSIGWQMKVDKVKVGLDSRPEYTADTVDIIREDDETIEEFAYAFVECRSQFAFFLPFEENKNVFGFINWRKVDWFFTVELTGCDIFVATKCEGDPVLVIHSNCNTQADNQTANKIEKAKNAKDIVDAHSGYRMKFRVIIEPQPGDPEHQRLNRYLNNYKHAWHFCTRKR